MQQMHNIIHLTPFLVADGFGQVSYELQGCCGQQGCTHVWQQDGIHPQLSCEGCGQQLDRAGAAIACGRADALQATAVQVR